MPLMACFRGFCPETVPPRRCFSDHTAEPVPRGGPGHERLQHHVSDGRNARRLDGGGMAPPAE